MKYASEDSQISLGVDSNGQLSTQLPQGLYSDLYSLNLIVYIIDDFNGKTVYHIPQSVTVLPNDQQTQSYVEAFLNNNFTSKFLLDLNSGCLDLVGKNVIFLANWFNLPSNSLYFTNTILITEKNDQLASWRSEILLKKINELSISNIRSIKIISSALALITNNLQQVTMSIAVFKFSLKKVSSRF